MSEYKRSYHRLSVLFRTLVGLTALCSILGFVGKEVWPFEQFSNFRWQYVFGLSAGALFFLKTRRHVFAGAVTLLALINLAQIIPGYIPAANDAKLPGRQILRIASVNVQASNRERKQLSDFVEITNPDFLLLLEVDPSWQDFADRMKSRFSSSEVILTPGNFGLALYSRYPIGHTEIRHFAAHSQYAIVADLEIDEQPLTIIGAHVTPPIKESLFRLRNQHFRELARIARNRQGPVILAGDLNASTWSPSFRDLVRDTKLRDARTGFGVQPTWPVQIPFLRIPIDHFLVSGSVNVENWIRGPDIGSDHFPILVDFSIQEIPAQWAFVHRAVGAIKR